MKIFQKQLDFFNEYKDGPEGQADSGQVAAVGLELMNQAIEAGKKTVAMDLAKVVIVAARKADRIDHLNEAVMAVKAIRKMADDPAPEDTSKEKSSDSEEAAPE